MKGVLIGWLLGLATGCAVTFFAAIYQLGDVLRDNAKLPAPRSLLIVRTTAAAWASGEGFRVSRLTCPPDTYLDASTSEAEIDAEDAP